MSRFAIVSLLALAGAVGTVVFVERPAWPWALGVLIGAYVVLLGLGVAFIRMSYFCEAICHGRPGRKQIALTFDDGPDPAATPALLDALKKHNAGATFFCVGRRAREQPGIVRRIAEEGHALGNHSFTHRWGTNFLFGRRLREEIDLAQEAIKDASGGAAPVYFRSPMGLTNPHLRSALRRAGLVLVGWDIRPMDRGQAPERTIEHVLRKARDGSIIVMHDGGARPDSLVAAAGGILSRLGERGFTFVPLHELLRRPAH